jgi:hypothetical protein
MEKKSNTLNKHSAAGANAGFDYQFERALHWLSVSPAGFVVGVETDDDVAILGQDGSRILEQAKHSVSDGSFPFSNRSEGLWNTLAIWIEAADSGHVSIPSTRFIMTTNKPLTTKCIAHQISAAKEDADISACIKALELAAKDPSQTISSSTERVLRPSSRNNLHQMIRQCELVDASASSAGAESRAKIIAQLQLPKWCASHADSIVDELLGWLHKVALTTWREQKPFWVSRDNFVNQMHEIINRRTRELTRERAENLIPVSAEKVGKEKGSLFVKQIYLITDDDIMVETAIREYIRCNIEKLRLSEEGSITDEDWIAFETALQSRWEKLRSRILRMSSEKPVKDVGFEVFTETTEDHREKLAGSETGQVYLTSGTYHHLANLIKVGWHPKFKELLGGKGEQ